MGEITQSRVIDSPSGPISGYVHNDVAYFDSVVYATAQRFGAASATITADGDRRLMLSITTPSTAHPLSDLPVVIFIHGGSFVSGSYQDEWLNGAGLAAHGVITVSVEYRLGFEGFIPFCNDEPEHYRGVDDCNLAVEWVQRNIESFGGDPTNVTLMGHSAGGGIALWLTRRDHYRGGFRRVWALSPAFPHTPVTNRTARLRFALSSPLTRTRLAARDDATLDAACRRFQRLVPTDLAVGPSPLKPDELASIPLVLSSTQQEMLLFPAARRIDNSWWGSLTRPLFRRALHATPQWRPPASDAWLGYLIGDRMIRHPVLRISDSNPTNTWLIDYRGTPDRPIYHCADIPWVLGNTNYLTIDQPEFMKNPPQLLLDVVATHCLHFIRGQLPSWPVYGTNRDALSITSDGAAAIITDPLGYLREGLT